MKAHRWRPLHPGLRRCDVCDLEERTLRSGRPPIYSRRPGTGLLPPPEHGGPCPGPPRTSPIAMPRRLAAGLVSGEVHIARIRCQCSPPIPRAVATVFTAAGHRMGEVLVGAVRHELLGWISWPTYEHADDPQLSGYTDPEDYIAELADGWGVTPQDAATTWVWRIQVSPYREEVGDA